MVYILHDKLAISFFFCPQKLLCYDLRFQISRLCTFNICIKSSVNNFCFIAIELGIRSSEWVIMLKLWLKSIFFYLSEELLETQNISLHDWVNKERFPVFMKLSPGNFHQVMKTKKYIVIAVLEENQIGGLTLKMTE